MKKGRAKSFGLFVSFYCMLAGTVVIMLFSGVVYTVVSKLFINEAVSRAQIAIETSTGSIEEYIRHMKSLLGIFAKDGEFLSYLEGDQAQKSQVLDRLRAIRQSDDKIFEVFLVPENDEPISGGEHNLTGLRDFVEEENPCLSTVRVGEYAHNDPWILTIHEPVFGRNGDQLGVLVMDLDYCLFGHTVESLDMGERGAILIQNGAGELIYHTDPIKLLEENTANQIPQQYRNGYNRETNILTHSTTIPGTGWLMTGIASLDGLEILQKQLFQLVALTSIFLFLVLLVITLTVSRKLTKPISRLADKMEHIGSLADLTIQKGEFYETVILTESYNSMILRIKELMRELEHKQGELRQFELDALTSQINPHFLYNTLDTIVWLAEFKDNDKIIELTKSLAAFFRLSLNGGRPIVSLYDEVEHVKHYLSIQKERYGDKLSYSFCIEEETLDSMVPKIILQPLVENALYHGVKPMEGAGCIIIKAEADGTKLLLSVSDNGVGFDAGPGIPVSGKKSGGVGLQNVERRIKLYYGEEGALELTSAPGRGTRVILKLNRVMIHPPMPDKK